MSTWAPNTDKVIDKGFGLPRNGHAVIGAITHHVAGTNGRDYVANYNSRNSHPTYHIASDGTVTGIVHPDRRPTSTGHHVDESCITVEIDNTSTGGDWPVSQAALDAWAEIIRHHANESPRRGKTIVRNIPGKAQDGFYVGMHSQYVATACPGPFVTRHLDSVIAKANGGSPAPTKPTTPAAPNPKPIPTKKSVATIAAEVLAGKWGNGHDRRVKLTAAGYNPEQVQAEVNRRLGLSTTRPVVNIDALARAVIRGEYGNGDERKRRLGANYEAVQKRVNELI